MEFDDLKKYWGKPYYEAPNCLIYCADCLDLMPILPDNIFNLTVTSPPYNIGKEYEQPLSLSNYVAWSLKWIAQVYRLTVDDGAFWLNLGYTPQHPRAKALPLPYLLWDKNPFFLIQEIVWHYGAGVAGRKFFSPRNEKFLWYVKNADDYIFNLDDVRDPNVKYPNQKKNGKLKVNPNGKNPSDVWQIKKVTSGNNRSSAERTPHPAQFPEEVIERIILASSHHNQWIFDPFMGSGTTAITALKLGRPVVGIEIQSAYCDIIAHRVEAFLSKPVQNTLFVEG